MHNNHVTHPSQSLEPDPRAHPFRHMHLRLPGQTIWKTCEMVFAVAAEKTCAHRTDQIRINPFRAPKSPYTNSK